MHATISGTDSWADFQSTGVILRNKEYQQGTKQLNHLMLINQHHHQQQQQQQETAGNRSRKQEQEQEQEEQALANHAGTATEPGTTTADSVLKCSTQIQYSRPSTQMQHFDSINQI
jgi:hypothetical protein